MEDYAATCSSSEARGAIEAAVEACRRAWINTRIGNLRPEEQSMTLYNLGRVQKKAMKLKDAETSLKVSLELEEGISGPSSLKSGRRLAELCAVLIIQRRAADGAPYIERLLAIAPQYQGSERQFVAGLFYGYSEDLKKSGQPELSARLEQGANNLGFKRSDFPSD
jgi:hypothetical protein